MARIITFSRQFPQYHPRAGDPTYFVEKLIRNFLESDLPGYHTEHLKRLRDLGYLSVDKMLDGSKGHTIRAGHRFKKGDKFSPRVWSGKPYRSKQIILGPDVEVVNTWDFKAGSVTKDLVIVGEIQDPSIALIRNVATNDGLSLDDFWEWIMKPADTKELDGQIICWDKTIKYNAIEDEGSKT